MLDTLQQIVASEHQHPYSVGIFDETGHPKKGDKTPGVQRQWCGHAGKKDNCVVTVHLNYTAADFHCLLDGELFLPESWADDPSRCEKCGGELFQRDDDKPDIIKKRLDVYENMSAPIKYYYAKAGILRTVDAKGSVDEVTKKIIEMIDSV